MPLYEYRCNTCGEIFEKKPNWSKADHNPNCSSEDTKKENFHGIGARFHKQ